MNTLIENAVCTFCGCLCDDITVEVDNNKIVKTKRACTNGRGLFMEYDSTPRKPLVYGKADEIETAWLNSYSNSYNKRWTPPKTFRRIEISIKCTSSSNYAYKQIFLRWSPPESVTCL